MNTKPWTTFTSPIAMDCITAYFFLILVVIPDQFDTSFACDFQDATICGYTSDSEASTVSRALIQQNFYLVIGAKDNGKETILLSSVSNINEEICLQIYWYCKDCLSGLEDPCYDFDKAFTCAESKPGTWQVEYAVENNEEACFLVSGGILASQGSVIELQLSRLTSRVKVRTTILQGWLIIYRIDVTPGQCSNTGNMLLCRNLSKFCPNDKFTKG